MTGRFLLPFLIALAACGDRRRSDDAPAEPASEQADQVAAAPVPLDPARLAEVATIEVLGYRVIARDLTATSLVVSLDAAPLRALVTVAPCLACRPADPARWQDAIPELRQLMPGGVEDDPATSFELRAADVEGHACIATWELGAVAYGDEVVATHGARLYCNDGATELVVRVDDTAATLAHSPEAARAAAHRDAVEDAARDLASAYLARLTPP